MLTREDKSFLVYLSAGYLAFAEILSWVTSELPLCLLVSEYQKPHEDFDHQTCATLHEGIARFLVFIWNSATHDNILAFGTIMIAAFTWTLWRSTHRLWSVTNETAQRELRAYISVEPGTTFRQSVRRNARFEFRPNIVNNGRTPASSVKVLSNIDFKNPTVPTNFDFTLSTFGLQPGSIAAIGPGKDKFHASIFPRHLTWHELREHAKGLKFFHLWGQVTYEDIFKIERHTYFSFLVGVPTNKKISPLWLATNRHNYYD